MTYFIGILTAAIPGIVIAVLAGRNARRLEAEKQERITLGVLRQIRALAVITLDYIQRAVKTKNRDAFTQAWEHGAGAFLARVNQPDIAIALDNEESVSVFESALLLNRAYSANSVVKTLSEASGGDKRQLLSDLNDAVVLLDEILVEGCASLEKTIAIAERHLTASQNAQYWFFGRTAHATVGNNAQ